MRLEVIFDDYYDTLNKQISDYEAIHVDEKTLSFKITFAKPTDISKHINELDYLHIEFIMPE